MYGSIHHNYHFYLVNQPFITSPLQWDLHGTLVVAKMQLARRVRASNRSRTYVPSLWQEISSLGFDSSILDRRMHIVGKRDRI